MPIDKVSERMRMQGMRTTMQAAAAPPMAHIVQEGAATEPTTARELVRQLWHKQVCTTGNATHLRQHCCLYNSANA